MPRARCDRTPVSIAAKVSPSVMGAWMPSLRARNALAAMGNKPARAICAQEDHPSELSLTLALDAKRPGPRVLLADRRLCLETRISVPTRQAVRAPQCW